MIDRSGSMDGDRIEQAKSAMHAILRQMEAEAGHTKAGLIFYLVYWDIMMQRLHELNYLFDIFL